MGRNDVRIPKKTI